MNPRRMTLAFVLAFVPIIIIACGWPDQNPTAAEFTVPAPVITQTSDEQGSDGVVVSGGGVLTTTAPPGTSGNNEEGEKTYYNQVPISPEGITFIDNGKAFRMRSGERFLLNLGAEIFDWNVMIDNPAIISREINVMTVRGSQGLFSAHQPGRVELSAVGDPFCRKSVPSCGAPSVLFAVTILVQ